MIRGQEQAATIAAVAGKVNTDLSIAIYPHILHTARYEARPARQLLLIAELIGYVGDEHGSGLREVRMRSGHEERLAGVRVMLELEAYEKQDPDYRSIVGQGTQQKRQVSKRWEVGEG